MQPCCMEPGIVNLTDFTTSRLEQSLTQTTPLFPPGNFQIIVNGPNSKTIQLIDLTFAINGLFFVEAGYGKYILAGGLTFKF